MVYKVPLYDRMPADSFLEYAFLRWVLAPAVDPAIAPYLSAQTQVTVDNRHYRIDYTFEGETLKFAIELDGYTYHTERDAFTYDRMRQNDLHTAGWLVIRFSYDAVRLDVSRCISQLQTMLVKDKLLATYLIEHPFIEQPLMDPDPMHSFDPPRRDFRMAQADATYFDTVRHKINRKTLRMCQTQAIDALTNYYGSQGTNAACIMSVGAGKTALGVLACLVFAKRRAMIITPGSVIRGTFDKALDYQAVGNVLYGMPAGPLIPGCKPPRVITLDRESGPIHDIINTELLNADVIVTNFHSLGTGNDPDDLLSKLNTEDVDFIVVDEAHIAAAESYQRAFRHFRSARTLLMSACFQRLDGKPIEADVVYRYRLIDSIADGNAKNLRVRRFAPEAEGTTYEMIWPDGRREEVIGRDALLTLLTDERQIARITAKSDMSIRQVMRGVKEALNRQSAQLYPVKPRVLFSALGERHAEQIARIATEYGIASEYLHYSMTESRIKSIRTRFEQDSGDLQGIVQLKMLGQGYDFPPICLVVPMRPYGSFSEFYQFIGRGIRVIQHPALLGRVSPGNQFLDIIYHAELGLDEHIETIYRENDMEPPANPTVIDMGASAGEMITLPGTRGSDTSSHPETFVLFEQGTIESRIVHDQERVELRRTEREQEALAQRYAQYVQSTPNPVTFEQFVQLMRMLSE